MEPPNNFIMPLISNVDPRLQSLTVFTDEPNWTNTFTRNFGKLEFDSNQIQKKLNGTWHPVDNAVRDDVFMARMIANYIQRQSEHQWRNDFHDTWNQIVNDHSRTIEISVVAGDYDMCYKLFSHMYGSALMHGIQQGFTMEFWLRNFPRVKDWVLLNGYDCLLGFLEFMGVTGVQNPEQGANMLDKDFNPALKLAFQRLAKWGYPNLVPPKWQGGLYALQTDLGVFDARMFQSLYQAVKIARKLENNFDAPICEIGGGSGYVIYWLYSMGFKNLTIVDLPEISLCQAWMLRQNIGPDVVGLGNETHDSPISVVGPAEFVKKDYALVINSDSLPEMHKSVILNYLDHIQQHCQWFYSINQEAAAAGSTNGIDRFTQQVVRHIIYNEYPKMKLIDRNVFWMRKGYTEEWYQMK